jgi:hypothetical protein
MMSGDATEIEKLQSDGEHAIQQRAMHEIGEL